MLGLLVSRTPLSSLPCILFTVETVALLRVRDGLGYRLANGA